MSKSHIPYDQVPPKQNEKHVILNPDEPAPDLDPEQHFGHEIGESAFSEDLHRWAEEHTHYTREARDQCAAGDHQYAKLLDDAAEREKLRELIDRPQGEAVTVSAEDYVTMAEEPIERRLQRAWLNGFKEGVDRAAFAATESTGRWDY